MNQGFYVNLGSLKESITSKSGLMRNYYNMTNSNSSYSNSSSSSSHLRERERVREREGFTDTQKFMFYDGHKVYDDFYCDVYDHLVYNTILDEYEIGIIMNKSTPTNQSIILDIGSGTGHMVSKLADENLTITGMDISSSMVAKAKENYPDLNFVQGDALNATAMQANSFTHILCMYFTFYYMDNQMAFFNNTMKWLKPGGYLIVHLVERDMFDPIIPPANPLLMLTPQRYAKERITKSSVTFEDFKYNAEFQLNKDNDTAKFAEKFAFHDGKVRKNEHLMYMPNASVIVDMAKDAGFIVEGKADLIKAGYEYQYLYIFVKPN